MCIRPTAVGLAALLLACALSPVARAERVVERLVPGGPFKGIHGLGFGPDGMIYVGSVMGQSIHRVDPQSGSSEVVVPPVGGLADDIEFGPDGTLYWTGFTQGTLNAMTPGQGLRVLASGLPGLNSLAMDAKGRLFATQVFAGDALWEFDPTGSRAPRKILEGMGGLNGFDFGPDERLCGPLWFKGVVVCIDVDSAEMAVVAEGFVVPAAANFDSQGRLHAIDNETGEVFRIDTAARTRERVAVAPSNLDNLAFSPDDRLFVSNMSDNAIYEVPLDGGAVRRVVGSPLSLPGGIGLAGNTLYVADTFTLSAVDLGSGELRDIDRSLATNGFPTALAASATRILSASFESGAVQAREPGGRLLRQWTGLAAPSAVAILADGSYLVAETGSGKLLRLDERRPEAREIWAEGLAQPMGLAVAGRTVYVSESAAGAISVIGGPAERPRRLLDGLSLPEGLALLPDGRLAIAETGRGRLLLLDPKTGVTDPIATGLPIGIPDVPGQPRGIFPTGVAAGPDGTIYLSSDRESSILRLSPAAR
jgi:sugar lactone lactonase YvrE